MDVCMYVRRFTDTDVFVYIRVYIFIYLRFFISVYIQDAT